MLYRVLIQFLTRSRFFFVLYGQTAKNAPDWNADILS